jgi:hypothetical protein
VPKRERGQPHYPQIAASKPSARDCADHIGPLIASIIVIASARQKNKVEKVMHEHKEGTLIGLGTDATLTPEARATRSVLIVRRHSGA